MVRTLDDRTVCIDLARFGELLSAEVRMKILEDMLVNDMYISTEDALRVIGTESAIKKADEIKDRNSNNAPEDEYE